jgi:hypothetical protein
MSPIYVPCHLCHAQVGELCKFGLCEGEIFHSRRVIRANVLQHDTWPPLDTKHGLEHGTICTPNTGENPYCTACGQSVARLQNIPHVLQSLLPKLLGQVTGS